MGDQTEPGSSSKEGGAFERTPRLRGTGSVGRRAGWWEEHRCLLKKMSCTGFGAIVSFQNDRAVQGRVVSKFRPPEAAVSARPL